MSAQVSQDERRDRPEFAPHKSGNFVEDRLAGDDQWAVVAVWLRHEFHSLGDEPQLVERDGRRVHRFEPGIRWTELSNAPAATTTRALRLTQMRREAQAASQQITIERSLAPNSPVVLGTANALAQVLLKVATNALASMPHRRKTFV